MLVSQLIISVFIISCNSLSIGTVSDRNVAKREANVGDLFPDWVPFKNKHGDDLGEFVQVVTKNKVKKRLAPPVNFILRAVAEPEGDDYYDKGQGESDGEEDFEKKEWSDLNRPAHAVAPNDTKSDDHSALSDIDGVVDILTKTPNNTIVEAIKKLSQPTVQPSNVTDNQEKETKEKDEGISEDITTEKSKKEDIKVPLQEYDADYEDEVTDKPKLTEEEQSENEKKKASILDSVDELKERHAEEQKAISEKIKEEEIYKEEHERNKMQPEDNLDKYVIRRKPKKVVADYEEYVDKDSVEDKYKFHPRKIEATTFASKRINKNRGKKNKKSEVGKLSVFKNPQLYIIYDDQSEETTTTVTPTKTNRRFSSRYSTTPSSNPEDDGDRISFVPDNSAKEGEPTLFFPKKKKANRRRIKTTTPATDTDVAETVADKFKRTKVETIAKDGFPTHTTAADTTVTDTTATDTTATDTTATDTTATDTTAADTAPSVVDTAPSAPDTTLTDTNTVTDAVPAPSDHKKKEKKNENYDIKKGSVRDYSSEHEETHEEHGKKAYKGHHEDTKTAKGHKDKEDHLDKYDDHGGIDKHHHHETGHYGDHHHEEHGKKHAKYEESGKHSKGHSTKGSHDIHKKEEYEKKVEFFEEEGDSGEEEKHGGHDEEHGHSEGGHFKTGKLKAGHEGHSKGESGHFGKGGHFHDHKNHRAAAGHDSHGQHGASKFDKGGKSSGKKWIYHHGRPAKTANLVPIDRRGDRLYHGLQYYG